MRIVFCGDVVGKPGRKVIEEWIPRLRQEYSLDFVVVNGENAAHGFGLTTKICEDFWDLGVDIITTGNHCWDQKEIIPFIQNNPRLLRPINFPVGTPGKGWGIFTNKAGKTLAVGQAMGRLFMEALDDPFSAMLGFINQCRLGDNVSAAIVDFHAEASSEKTALANFLDGKISLLAGTHTHIPTADARILSGGTGFISDVGMCGDYDSVIGMRKEAAISKFLRKVPNEKLEPADGEGTLCAVFLETDDNTGLATQIRPLRLGGVIGEKNLRSLA